MEQAVTQQHPASGTLTFSPTVGKIALALSKAQGDIKPAVKDSINPHFRSKYANLAGIWDACRDQLAKNEISVVQSPSTAGSVVRVTTMLVHSSGEWIMGEVSARARDDSPQSVGSATTYLRRYHLDSMVGVSSDEDDDGQAAQPEQPQPEQQPKGRKTQQSKDPADQAFGARAAAEAAAKAAGKTTSEKQPNDRIYDNNRLDRRKRLIATLSAMPYVPEGDRVAICQQLHGRHVEDLKTVIDEVRLQREARIAGEPTSQEVPV